VRPFFCIVTLLTNLFSMPILMTRATPWTVPAAIGIVLLLITWAYWPGLSGPFLLDDYGNLDVLGAYGRIDSWQVLLYYLSSGSADPTGRPLALLSFLLDASTWPAEPWPFKRTNLVLHLLNTGLLALVVRQLQARLSCNAPQADVSRWTPLLAATLWGAHPFFVSTTLYVVQREAMLPMVFVLLALLACCRSVHCFDRGQAGRGWSWMFLGVGGATLLAGLSKANGFLAPLLAGLTYLWFLRGGPRPTGDSPRAVDLAAALCLGLPSLLLLLYLLHVGWQLWPLPYLTGRDWTIAERLLSEPRALWTYVWRLVLPRAGGGGIYVDDFVASHGWLTPVTTIPALLALVASVIAAVRLRRRFPVASFAWIFFLSAHLLESTTVPLELYFEHRNYLPAMFLGWPLAHALLRPGAYPRYRMVGAGLLTVVFLLLTHQRAVAWGDESLLGVVSAANGATSPRAQVEGARQEIEHGNVAAGLRRIHAVQRMYPESVDIAISSVGMECAVTGALTAESLSRTLQTLVTARSWNYGLYRWLQDAAVDPTVRSCRGFGSRGIGALVTAAEANPQSAAPRRKRDLLHVRGRVALAEKKTALALHWFDAALLLEPDPEYALVQAGALGDAGAPALGVRHLDLYARLHSKTAASPVRDMPSAHAWLLRHYGYYNEEVTHLRRQLQADAQSITSPKPDTGGKDRR
jgi:hypothetical protein